MKTALLALTCVCTMATAMAAEGLDRKPVEATTVKGEKVLLYPNGRWEFVDAGKAEEAKKVAGQYPENQSHPADAQGGLFGVGRTVSPGDKDYNRGSLNPKLH